MQDVLNQLIATESLAKLGLVALVLGLALGIVNLASWIIPLRSKKEITYDNLDKEGN